MCAFEEIMEECFTVSKKSLAAALGFARFAVLGSVLCILLAVFSLRSIGSGFVICSLLALYFLGMLIWQWRQYRLLSRAAIMLDADGLLVSYGGKEVLYTGEELCLDQGCLPRVLGFGKKMQVCRAFLVCGHELFVDAETRSRMNRADAPVLGGRAIPLDADTYTRLLKSLERHGWNRPCREGVSDAAPKPPLRFAWLGTGLLALLASFFLKDAQFSVVFLLVGIGGVGLFLNTLYTKKLREPLVCVRKPPSAGENEAGD
ncbi:MAG: hypothetical protein LBC99_09680 [Spirochaetota bacterium]|jgi:hypothetical protein|nr:hypothetical protein [Spirochaetota bacterium]